MNVRTQRILLDAGYKIYRFDPINKQIRCAKSPGGWGVVGTYPSQAACRRAFEDILLDEKNLED